MKIHNLKQGSPEWFAIRELKLTGSQAQAIANAKDGLESLCKKLVMEFIYPQTKSDYTSESMENGNELESSARFLYEAENNVEVIEVGFIQYNDFIGVSPDGLVGEKGIIEIKCPTSKVFFDYMIDGKVDTKYEWQMQMQMLVSGRDWCDYVVYNPNFAEKGFIVKRIEKNQAMFEKLQNGFELGEKMIKELLKKSKGE